MDPQWFTIVAHWFHMDYHRFPKIFIHFLLIFIDLRMSLSVLIDVHLIFISFHCFSWDLLSILIDFHRISQIYIIFSYIFPIIVNKNWCRSAPFHKHEPQVMEYCIIWSLWEEICCKNTLQFLLFKFSPDPCEAPGR